MANKRQQLSEDVIKAVVKGVLAGRSQKELAQELKIHPQNMYSLVKRLRDRGQIPRKREEVLDLPEAPPDKAMKKHLEFYKARCIKLEAAVVELQIQLIENRGLNFL